MVTISRFADAERHVVDRACWRADEFHGDVGVSSYSKSAV